MCLNKNKQEQNRQKKVKALLSASMSIGIIGITTGICTTLISCNNNHKDKDTWITYQELTVGDCVSKVKFTDQTDGMAFGEGRGLHFLLSDWDLMEGGNMEGIVTMCCESSYAKNLYSFHHWNYSDSNEYFSWDDKSLELTFSTQTLKEKKTTINTIDPSWNDGSSLLQTANYCLR